jgi:hypothetical protein
VDRVGVGAAVDQHADLGRDVEVCARLVVAAEPFNRELIAGRLGVGDRGPSREVADLRAAAAGGHRGDINAVGRADDHLVGRGIAAAPERREVLPDVVDVGSREIVDDGRVGASKRAVIDDLDVVQVHEHGAEVAGQAHPPAVGEQLGVLVPVAAIEAQPVHVVLALEHVAAVAGIPLHRVLVLAGEDDVVALLGVDEVAAVAAEHDVDAVAAEDRVGAVAGLDHHLGERREVARGEEGVTRVAQSDLRGIRGRAGGGAAGDRAAAVSVAVDKRDRSGIADAEAPVRRRRDRGLVGLTALGGVGDGGPVMGDGRGARRPRQQRDCREGGDHGTEPPSRDAGPLFVHRSSPPRAILNWQSSFPDRIARVNNAVPHRGRGWGPRSLLG